MNKDNLLWTEAETNKLLTMRAEGFPYAHIARVLGRSNDACRAKAKHLSKTLKVETPEKKVINVLSQMYRGWSPEDLRLLYDLRQQGMPFALIALQMNRSEHSCASKYKVVDWNSIIQDSEEDKEEKKIFGDKKKDYVERCAQTLDRRNLTQKIWVDIVHDKLRGAIAVLPTVPLPKFSLEMPNSHKEEEAILILSDIHIGAEHTWEETGGISQYNRDIAAKRMKNLMYAVRDITVLHRNLYDIPTLHVTCLGDIVAGDNTSGEWSYSYISDPIVNQVLQGFQMIKEALGYWLSIFKEIIFYGVRGNHGRCLSRSTQILTPQGFMVYNYLKVGDLVGTVNMKSKKFEFQPIKKIHIYPKEKEILNIGHSNFKMEITKDHNILVQDYNSGNNLKKIKSQNLSSCGRYTIPTSFSSSNIDYDISDSLLFLLGIIMTDGCYDKRSQNIYIYQSKVGNKIRIRGLLKENCIPFTEYSRHRDGQIIAGLAVKVATKETRFTILSSEWAKRIRALLPIKESIPVWMYSLSDRQVALLLDAIVVGDGCIRKDRKETDGYTRHGGNDVVWGKRGFLIALSGLLISHGISCSVNRHKRNQIKFLVDGSEQGSSYYLQIRKRSARSISSKNVKKIKYNDVVWCVSVDNGTIAVMDDSGQPYFTGNCGAPGTEKDYSNWDYLCYKMLEDAFRDNSRIKFVVPKTWWILEEICGKKFLMVHGEDIRGNSMPVKKLTDFEDKMTGIIQTIPDYTLAAHFHRSCELSTNNGCVMLNGAFLDGDVYSIKTIHAKNRPEQVFFGINSNRGRTWKYNIDLDDERSPDRSPKNKGSI